MRHHNSCLRWIHKNEKTSQCCVKLMYMYVKVQLTGIQSKQQKTASK